MLILIEGNDVMMFKDTPDVESYLEPWYVQEEEFGIVDGEGNMYNASVDHGKVKVTQSRRATEDELREMAAIFSKIARACGIYPNPMSSWSDACKVLPSIT